MVKTISRDEVHLGYTDLAKNELRNPRLQQLGADISSPVEGLFFERSDTHRFRVYLNGAWQDMATMADVTAAGISANLVDAKGDLIVGTADNTVAREAVGANGTFYVADSAQTGGHSWRVIADTDLPGTITRDSEALLQSLAAAKGDSPVATAAGTWGKLTVGADGTFLVAASGQATGQQWRVLQQSDLQEKIATADLTDWPRTAPLDINGQKITGIADGTAVTDAASYGQLLAVIEGKKWKDPVAAVALGNITLSGTQTIDGYSAVAGDRVLAAGQTLAQNNGVYIVAAGAWTRATDANSAAEVTNATVISQNGTLSKGDVFTQSAAITTLGTDNQTWVKTGEGNQTYLDDGSTTLLTGNVFSVKTGGITNTQINAAAAIARSKLDFGTGLVNADLATGAAIAYSKLNLATSIVNADIASGAAIAYSKLALGGNVVNADIAGGAAIAYSKLALAGALLAADVNGTAVASGTGVVRVTRTWVGPTVGGAASEVLTHGLGTRDVKVTICNQNPPWDEQEFETARTTTNTITVSSPVNIPAGLRVIVTG